MGVPLNFPLCIIYFSDYLLVPREISLAPLRAGK
jgi:hypothetical protein